ncbi:MAG: ATP-binding protein [Candidatus Bathyarchaeota archaeon]|nr:MAG: ATP-binding protein [Candidatus Bathyarchaeota archaeon]
MRLYRKEGNTVQILALPTENVEKGEYLLIEDPATRRSLITQVIDVQFANVPGILEELLRNSTTNDLVHEESFDPLGVISHVAYIQDSRLLVCKIRGTMEDGKLRVTASWLPSRSQSTIKKLPTTSLLTLAKISADLPIQLGETRELSQFNIDAQTLDGRLNIVTGKKETGKSHLSKLLVMGLIDHGAMVVVLDLNGEYTHLGFSSNGEKNEHFSKIQALTPGDNLKMTLPQMKLRVMLDILIHALHLPGTSAREFRRIWRFLQEQGTLTLHELGETIKNWKCNTHVRDALFSRYYSLLNSRFFTDNPADANGLEENFRKIRNGGALVINLHDISLVDRQVAVEYVLGKLVEMLTQWKIKAVFLFAEEAHLYLRETYWDDIVTRMRHFGVFTTFVTNQPNTIRENIYRQADNVFLFNFTNEHDLEVVSRAAKVDAETVKSVARDLPPRHCLVLGRAVKDFPVVVRVKALDVQAMGHTRLFFTEKN